jgi:dephospho-CoA kinase
LNSARTIGVIGGIASGKSTVAKMLVELGGHALDADQIGHQILADDPDVKTAVVNRWGNDVLAADGQIDRRAVARRVFAPAEAGNADRRFLEELLHPRIRQLLAARRDELLAAGKTPVVIEPSMLLESGSNLAFDVLMMVDAPRDERLARARQRGWSEEQFAAREAAQWPVEEKRRRADVAILNDGTQDELRRAVEAFWQTYVIG